MLVYMLTFGDIWGILMVNVTIYNIHGSYGINSRIHRSVVRVEHLGDSGRIGGGVVGQRP